MKTRTTLRNGDHVRLMDGEYAGCLLTFLRVDPLGYCVCRLSTGEEVKAQEVAIYRLIPEGVLVDATGPAMVRS